MLKQTESIIHFHACVNACVCVIENTIMIFVNIHFYNFKICNLKSIFEKNATVTLYKMKFCDVNYLPLKIRIDALAFLFASLL